MVQFNNQDSITAERIESLRNMRSLTKREVADAAGMSASLYSHKIHDLAQFMPKEVAALADFFEVSTDYLLGRIDTRWPDPWADKETA